ncbi:hypothetical protein [Caniella muris]|uniref:hypothetical protein n=1 Tax=Caniella muris TaxID=2941502 RepID=UPI00203D6114|nr:hypothetical protein [Caniella muris]
MARPVAQTAFARRTAVPVAALLAACVAVALCVLVLGGRRAASDQGAASLRESILSAAGQCAAVEGAYPADLDHLVGAYGIRFDPSAYDVRYEAFADNVAPTVEVRAR